MLPAEFRREYYQLYRTAFAPSYRAGEQPLGQRAFFERMFPSDLLDQIEGFEDSRLAASEQEGAPSGSTPRPLLVNLQNAVGEAAGQPTVRRELQAYKAAKKAQVCRNVERTRTRWVDGWDEFSTNCANWYLSPIGCPSRRRVSEPYQERVCQMQFPEDLANPLELMRGLQDRYFATLNEKLAASLREAELRRQEIQDWNQFGSDSIWNSVLAFAAFLSLMFLYLLVALERHHRALSRRIAPAAE